MSTTISEFALFKRCVENPSVLDRNLSQLNLSFIRDPATPADAAEADAPRDDSLEASQRRALRLFYMVWSGLTKCMRNLVQQQRKAIEIANFAIFGPIADSNQGRDPLDKGYGGQQARQAKALGMSPVFVVINDDFLNQMNWEVALDQSSEKAVGRFNKLDKAEVNDLFKNRIAPLAVSSIASVALTDSATVELIIKEIVTSIGELARQGSALRLNFKVGYLIIRN